MKRIILGTLFISLLVYGKIYEIPPSSSTRGSVPVISDEKMEECVKLYNENKWLQEEINNLYINRYDNNSVNNYNNKVRQQNIMTKKFNIECAGKQSYSAWKATQKLNKGY